jgi:hypothetical protein
MPAKPRPETPPVCLLHIGKTGGSYLKSILQHNAARLPESLKLCGHAPTLRTTRARFGPDRRLAFVVRDPSARFVSAFNSRMRQGRPTYNNAIWLPEEAAAFLWFETPNDLAEGLGSCSERVKSAAIFAMESITHLRKNYQHYLGSVKLLKQEDANIALCIDLDDLDANLDRVLARLGVAGAEIPADTRRHAAPPGLPSGLSPAGEAALRAYWAEEYRIYDHCRSIARF